MKWQTNGPVPRSFEIEVDGFALKSKTIQDLFAQYARGHDQAGLRLPLDWEDRVWIALSKRYPKYVKRQRGKPTKRSVSLRQALNFVRFLSSRVTDRSLVSPQVANTRASVCSVCPMATRVSGCAICKDALQLTVSPPEEVKCPESCSACGCYLPLKIWVPRSQLGPADDFEFHHSCWMHSED